MLMMKSKYIFFFCVTFSFFIIGDAAKGLKNRIKNRSTTPSTTTTTTQPPKCANNQSPAQECFDYLVLAVAWTPGYTYKVQANAKIRRKNLSVMWMIHGLWPSMFDRSDVTSRCARTDIFFNDRHLNVKMNDGETLTQKLQGSWHSVLHKAFNQRTDSEFWGYEFEKHGRCVCRIDKIKDDVTYFLKTYQLYVNFVNKMRKAFNDNQYKLGSVKTIGDLIDYIKREINVNVKIGYVSSKDPPKKGEIQNHYLTEVFSCYNLELQPIDCPNPVGSETLKKHILYLDNFVD